MVDSHPLSGAPQHVLRMGTCSHGAPVQRKRGGMWVLAEAAALITELQTTVNVKQIGGFSLPHERNTGVGVFLTSDPEAQPSKSTLVREKMLAC